MQKQINIKDFNVAGMFGIYQAHEFPELAIRIEARCADANSYYKALPSYHLPVAELARRQADIIEQCNNMERLLKALQQ